MTSPPDQPEPRKFHAWVSNPQPSSWTPLLCWIVPLALIELGIVPYMWQQQYGPQETTITVVFSALGAIFAQGALLTVGLVWGTQPFAQRLLVHWIVAINLYGCWNVGYWYVASQENGWSHDWREVASTVACTVPVMALAAQGPLWITRVWLGWRLLHVEMESTALLPPPELVAQAPNVRKLSVLDLMTATACVAVSLGVYRLVSESGIKNLSRADLLFDVITASTFAVGVSLLGILPIVCLFFSRASRILAFVLSIAYAILVCVIFIVIIGAISRVGVPTQIYRILIPQFLSFAIVFGIGLTCLREKGWRLVR